MTSKTLASSGQAMRATETRPTKRRDLSGLSLCISPAILLIIWELCTRSGWVSPQLLPAPSSILLRVLELAGQADFWQNLGITVYRLISGLLIACVAGVALALIAQLTRWSSFLLDALIRLLAPIPKIALYPALILIMGFESSSKIALVVSDAIFPVLMASWVAAQTVDRKLIWSARAAGTSRSACLWKIILPAISPTVLAGVRVAGVIACVVVFLAEMIASTDGLGHMLTAAARSYRTIDMFVPLVWICVLGFALNLTIAALQRKVDHTN
ncbi:ABC transporter permease [Alcaligenes pakistanensis]|uniref:ABC transporter permease n=1 Tax=Alcaligenes pakistanensis TaxID=1482717 RepID=A0A8H9IHJ3_9BURK|nr:ABC transporter permease [Alcaligenes pakistanensis]GHC41686.1 ABC transporter permease [Alcaligenes pakistanensis]